MSPLLQLSLPALSGLAKALESGRVSAPFNSYSLEGYVPATLREQVTRELNHLHKNGATHDHMAYTLQLLAEERRSAQRTRDNIELVWTGIDPKGSTTRDTSVVVRELFELAQSSVLIVSYALDSGSKARQIFEGLANKMDCNSKLNVRMFVNIHRLHKSKVPSSILLREFSEKFRNEIWPGKRLPEVYYDPRSLEGETQNKACLHAKCLVIDERYLFITSANFTEAAHERNIEAGVLIDDTNFAKSICFQIDSLVNRNLLCRLAGIDLNC